MSDEQAAVILPGLGFTRDDRGGWWSRENQDCVELVFDGDEWAIVRHCDWIPLRGAIPAERLAMVMELLGIPTEPQCREQVVKTFRLTRQRD